MLNNLRNASKSIGMRIFFGILVVAFIVFWTAGDSSRFLMQGNSQTIATVDGNKIHITDFGNEVRRRLLIIKARTGVDPDVKMIVQSVLQENVAKKIIGLEADRMGMFISDKQVLEYIKKQKAFQDSEGAFDRDIYDNFLKISNYSEADIVNVMRSDMLRDQLFSAFFANINVPEKMLESIMMWNFEKRKVQVASVKFNDFNEEEKIDEEELKSYYDDHNLEFTIPEKRDFSVVLLDVDYLKKDLKLSDDRSKIIK